MSQTRDNPEQIDESRKFQKKNVSPFKLLVLAMACYLPAFGLVLLSFLPFSNFNQSSDSPFD